MARSNSPHSRNTHDWLSQLARVKSAAAKRAAEERRLAELHAAELARAATAHREHELFRLAVGEVKPLKRPPRVHITRVRPPPIPTQRIADERAVMGELLAPVSDWESSLETGEALAFLRQGLPRDILRKLRRGHWVVQSALDLHGHTSEAARVAVSEFLAHAIRNDHRCVRIIHGKGLGSVRREPVLKGKVKRFLQQRHEVLAFCEARNVDGGGGAVLVLLKSREREQGMGDPREDRDAMPNRRGPPRGGRR